MAQQTELTFYPNSACLNSSYGEITFDVQTGDVLHVCVYDKNETADLDKITRVDVNEWRAHYPGESITAGDEFDCLDFGVWEGTQYFEPAHDWRKEYRAQEDKAQ